VWHLPEDDNHHSHRRGNLKSYISPTSLMSRNKPNKNHSAEDGLVCCRILTLSRFTYFSAQKMEAISSSETLAPSEIHNIESNKAILFIISMNLTVATLATI
jgi:hypothetical protein